MSSAAFAVVLPIKLYQLFARAFRARAAFDCFFASGIGRLGYWVGSPDFDALIAQGV